MLLRLASNCEVSTRLLALAGCDVVCVQRSEFIPWGEGIECVGKDSNETSARKTRKVVSFEGKIHRVLGSWEMLLLPRRFPRHVAGLSPVKKADM